MSDSEDLNLNNKRKKRSPITEFRNTRLRSQSAAARKKRCCVGSDLPYTCLSDPDNTNTILTGRGDTLFVMATANSSTNSQTLGGDSLTYTQPNIPQVTTPSSSLIQNRTNFNTSNDPHSTEIDNIVSRAVRAAEANLRLKHHDELDALRKQIDALKLQINSNIPQVVLAQGPNDIPNSNSTGTIPKTTRPSDDLRSNLNPNANPYHNPRKTNSVNVPSFQYPYLNHMNNPMDIPNYSLPPPNHVSVNYPPPSYDNRRLNNSGNMASLNDSFGSVQNKIVPIHKWKIRYNGDGPVNQFLFKVDALRRKNLYDEEDVFNNFDLLLEGRAETFYWRFVSINPGARYSIFIRAFSIEFGNREKDFMILAKLSQRTQGMNESFKDYHDAMRTLLDRMEHKMPDPSFIDLVKTNSKPEISNLLYGINIYSKEALTKAGEDAEDQVNHQRKHFRSYFSHFDNRRSVSEIKDNFDPLSKIAELEASINELKLHSRRNNINKSDEEVIQGCFNCRSLDHLQKDCPEEVSEIYCFRCGKRGFITPKCPKCRQTKNLNQGDVNPGTRRPSPNSN